MWKTFKEELPEFNKPIFIYKESGVYDFFKKGDDIKRVTLIKKEDYGNLIKYCIKGYNYGNSEEVTIRESEFMKMKWMEIPKP